MCHSHIPRACLRAFVLLSLLTAGVQTVSAYEEVTVSNGGTVSGLVKFSGPVPQPVSFELRRYPDRLYCGALSDGTGYRHLRQVAVGEHQGLKDVIVTIEGVEKGKAFELQETRLEANICQIVPFVSVMRDQHTVAVTNLDSVAHDLQVYEREGDHIAIMFHRPALTKAGTSDVVRLTGNRRGVVLQCGMHPYMQGYGLAVQNPYYALTDLEGTFAIKDLPPGSYRIRAWHPILGEQTQAMTVTADKTVTVSFTFEGK